MHLFVIILAILGAATIAAVIGWAVLFAVQISRNGWEK